MCDFAEHVWSMDWSKPDSIIERRDVIDIEQKLWHWEIGDLFDVWHILARPKQSLFGEYPDRNSWPQCKALIASLCVVNDRHADVENVISVAAKDQDVAARTNKPLAVMQLALDASAPAFTCIDAELPTVIEAEIIAKLVPIWRIHLFALEHAEKGHILRLDYLVRSSNRRSDYRV